MVGFLESTLLKAIQLEECLDGILVVDIMVLNHIGESKATMEI
jgi:hypothetical protein